MTGNGQTIVQLEINVLYYVGKAHTYRERETEREREREKGAGREELI